MSEDNFNDYEVGRGKPPRHTRFKKGQSGNPSGRPKKEPSVYNVEQLRKLFFKEGNQPVRIIQDGEPVDIPAIQGIFKRLHKLALEGNLSAIKYVIDLHFSQREIDDASRLKLMEMQHIFEDIYSNMVGEFRRGDSTIEPHRIAEMHIYLDEVRARINDGLED